MESEEKDPDKAATGNAEAPPIAEATINNQATTDDNDYLLASGGWNAASLSSVSDAPLSWAPQEGEEEGYYDQQLGGDYYYGRGAQPGTKETPAPDGQQQQEQQQQEACHAGQAPWSYEGYTYEQYCEYYYQQQSQSQQEGEPSPADWEGNMEVYGGSGYTHGEQTDNQFEGLPPQEGLVGGVSQDGGPAHFLGESKEEAEKTASAAPAGSLAALHTHHRTRRLERLLRFMKRRPTFTRSLVPFQKPRAPAIVMRHPPHEPRRIIRLRKMVTILQRRTAVASKRAASKHGQEKKGPQARPAQPSSSSAADTAAAGVDTAVRWSKPWPVVVQYINEVFSQCMSPGAQSTIHWARLQAYRDVALLYQDLTRLDPYRRRMTGPLTITINLSRRRSVTSKWRLQQPADDGTVEDSLSGTHTKTTAASSHEGRGSSTTTHSTASSRQQRQSNATPQRHSSLKGLDALQGLIPVKRKSSLHPKDSQPPPPSESSSGADSTVKQVPADGGPVSRRKSSAHGDSGAKRKSSLLHGLHAPLSVSGRRRSSNRSRSSSSSGSSGTASRRQSTESSVGPLVSFPREVIRDHPGGANLGASRDVIPFDEGKLAHEPLALLHKILRAPGFDRVPKRIRDFGDRDYAILSSMVKADVMVRTRAVSSKAKSLAFLAMAHEQSLMGATVRLGSFLTRSDVACLACCNKQTSQLAKAIMRNQRAAVVAQSGVRLHLERQRFERLKHTWRCALHIQRVFRGYVLGRKKLQWNRLRLKRLDALGLEGDIIDVLEDKLLQPATRLEACRVIALLTKSRSVKECRALVELGLFKVVSDQLRASDNTQEILMMAITCLNNLLGGFTAPAPDPFRCHVIKALQSLLCSTKVDEVETACQFLITLSPTVARGFPLDACLLDCLVDLLMNPMEEDLFFKDFPFSLTARIKSWRLAAQAFLSAVAADPRILTTDVAREGAQPAVVSSLLSVLHVIKVCSGRLLGHKYSPALVRHVRCVCMETIPVLAALHKDLLRTYNFTDSYTDAQLALLADQLLHPSLSCSQPAHQHGLYILDIMCHDLRASMFLLMAGIAPTLESLLEIYLEGEMRDSLEKLVCLLTKPIVTPAEVAVPFNAITPGDEQKELEGVVGGIQSFDANKERFADQACHVLLKALEEKQ